MPLDDDLAHLPLGHVLVLKVNDAHRHAPHRQADRAGLRRPVEPVESGHRAGLRQAVPFQNLDLELLAEGAHDLDRHGRAAGDGQPQIAGDLSQVELLRVGVVEHGPVHRRHAGEDGHVVPLHDTQRRVGVEAWQQR